MHNTSHTEKGFVLLELMVVLFLITLILGISTVFFANSLPSGKFHATVRDMSSALRQARSLAQIHHERQVVTIDLDAKTYGLENRGSRLIPSGISIKIIDTMRGDLLDGKYQFIMHPSGGIEGGNIILWDTRRKASIQLDPVVGTIVIQ
jgi:prepilin-type N-terminal cleavage/methylation domain-containing protein